jgi:hypothetical protein
MNRFLHYLSHRLPEVLAHPALRATGLAVGLVLAAVVVTAESLLAADAALAGLSMVLSVAAAPRVARSLQEELRMPEDAE